MTSREVYDNLLTEINKVEAPSLLLESFNYYFGKAINETCNQWYNLYEENQLLTDNLRPLTRTISLPLVKIGNFYHCKLPIDYWHLLPNNTVTYTYQNPCNASQTLTYESAAIKGTGQMDSGIVKDYYTKPSYKRPYLFMHEVVQDSDPVPYDIQIKCGSDAVYKPQTLQINYLKMPKIKEMYLSLAMVDSIDGDTSPSMEFTENFCYEIIKKLTALVLEQYGDQRLQSNIPINQSMMPLKQG
jgi:hypothetical protein